MKILLVIDQFDADNNGTTMTARRLADTLVTTRTRSICCKYREACGE